MLKPWLALPVLVAACIISLTGCGSAPSASHDSTRSGATSKAAGASNRMPATTTIAHTCPPNTALSVPGITVVTSPEAIAGVPTTDQAQGKRLLACGYKTGPGSTFNIFAVAYSSAYADQAFQLGVKLAACAKPGASRSAPCTNVDPAYSSFRQTAHEVIGLMVGRPLGSTASEMSGGTSNTRLSSISAFVRTNNVICGSFGELIETDPRALQALATKIARAVTTACGHPSA